THQPRSMDVVPPSHRQGAMPDRRYLVADRDRSDLDHAHSWSDPDQARIGNASLPGGRPRHSDQRRCLRRAEPGRLSCHHASLALDAADDYGDPERFVKQYWSDIKGCYFTGDGARRDHDGYFWLMGRVDDVINVSGHRLGTMEIESALVSHSAVAEAAVVGRPDELKGQAVAAFVTLESGRQPSDGLKEELRRHVQKEIGAMAKPDDIRFTDALPKTRSGKIMRRLLRDIASGAKTVGDTTTLED